MNLNRKFLIESINAIPKRAKVQATSVALAGVLLTGGALANPNLAAAVGTYNHQETDGLISGIDSNLSSYLIGSTPQVSRTLLPMVGDVAPVDGELVLDVEFPVTDGEEVVVEEFVEEPTSEFSGIAVSNVEDFVNVRSIPSTEGEAVAKLYNSSAATVLEEVQTEDGSVWYHIQSGTVEGYVRSDFLIVGDEGLAQSIQQTFAVVGTDNLNIRKDASTEGEVMGRASNGQRLSFLEQVDGWVKVSVGEKEGFVSSDFVTVETSFRFAESREEEAARVAAEARANNSGAAVLAFAQQFVGNRYVWGGTSLTGGADCSGFTQQIFRHFGVSLPRTSGAQRSAGRSVPVSEMRPGDLVAYSGHVGIYAGGGRLLSALNSRSGITYNSVNYKPILSVRRLVE